jgi:hypothetical protein
MGKTIRYTQKNGRERGRAEGIGNGPNGYTPNVIHKGKHEARDRRDKRQQQRGWDD